LQTERDRERLLDGLDTALGGSGPTREELARLLGTLTQRVFLMRNVHDETPVLLKSRWALSYLRGPLTPAEIARLMAPRKNALASEAARSTAAAAPTSATASASAAASTTPATSMATAAPAGGAHQVAHDPQHASNAPPLPADVEQAFMPVSGETAHIVYRPSILGTARLHFIDKSAGIDIWETLSLSAPLGEDGEVAWDEAGPAPGARGTQVPGATFAPVPAAALRAASYARWSKSLAARLYQHQRLQLLACDALKMVSGPGVSEGDFRARLQLAARERRDAEAAKLRQNYEPRFATLRDQQQRAAQRVEREREQASQQKVSTAISVGATLLGALFGRKAVSSTSVGRATTAARNASRIGREAADVARAEESAESISRKLADLE